MKKVRTSPICLLDDTENGASLPLNAHCRSALLLAAGKDVFSSRPLNP